jgi:hypothetical protein
MHRATFFPLGCADTCSVDLANGKKVLLDYANVRDEAGGDDKRCDLPTYLRKDLKAGNRKDYDVVAFTHLDRDHYAGATEFFYLEHASKYQQGDRIRITELWVPAAVITEKGHTDEAAVIQEEARYRLRQGKGIRVFSRPDRLKEWLEKQGLSLDSRRHLITDAGQVVPGFEPGRDGVEWFAHSPFAVRQNESDVEDRNTDSLVLHATFVVEQTETKAMFASDVDHSVLTDIVNVTRLHEREERLEWDIFKLPHHCSYTALGPEKGKEETTPVPNVKYLFEDKGQAGAIIVAPCDPIPHGDTDLPPHRQAANYYRRILREKRGEFMVTMEHPRKAAPEPLVIKIDGKGAAVQRSIPTGVAAIVGTSAPRAG